MSDAADAIEAQDMDNVFLDKQLAALRSELEQVKGERDAMRGAIGNLFVIIGNYTGDEIKCDRITEKMWIADAYALKAGKG